MSTLPDLVTHLLHALLDRAEQPGRQQVIRVRLSKRDYAAYFDAVDGQPRVEANRAFEQLAAQEVLRLHWRKWEQGNWLDAVDLLPEQLLLVYRLLGRKPRTEQEQTLQNLLDAQRPTVGWHAAFLDWTRAQLADGRNVAPLDLADAHCSAMLLRTLDALANLQAPTLERLLSVRVFGDSKQLEQLRGPMLRVLRRHAPNAALFGEDDGALLRTYHLDRTPEYVPLAGPLVLDTPGGVLDLTPFAPSVALSAATLREATVRRCCPTVITVENAASFTELLRIRPANVALLFTGGFASPTVLHLLTAIQYHAPSVRLYHWGDLDAGGLRILAHLRLHVPAVETLCMNQHIFDQHIGITRPLTANDRTALETLVRHPLLTDCVPLIQVLLLTGRKLEQEAILAHTVMREIEGRM